MSAKPDLRFRRLKKKGNRDLAQACAIIDAALYGHVGFIAEGLPYVVPMALARDGQELLLHGSIASRLAKNLAEGLPCCVTITHFDGLVLARSAFNSSMHYRSVMIFGSARAITDPAQKLRGFDVLTDHLLPGRRSEIRASTRKEINATTLLSLPIREFTVKVSEAPPDDPASDLKSRVWAGVIPFTVQAGAPVPSPDLDPTIPLPAYLAKGKFR